jgi:two-component system chemotaxis response regulator CheB
VDTRTNRDIVVIGASAGGVHALRQLLADLPADLPASVFIVLHTGAISHLAEILAKRSRLAVSSAINGAEIQAGHVYVAVPDRHLLLHDRHILLRRGPRENLCRPAVDPLFRSAAATFGGRVIGIVLSGALKDGTAGLAAVKRCGGIAVIQDPRDAAVPDMPLSARKHVDIDHSVPIAELASLLSRLTEEAAGETPDIPLDVRLEAAIAAAELDGMATEDTLGTPSRFTCPECHGALWELSDPDILRYRCHVGHAFTADAVFAGQETEAERLLENLMRSYRERAALMRRMSTREGSMERGFLAERYAVRSKEYDENAELVKRLLGERPEDSEPSPADVAVSPAQRQTG